MYKFQIISATFPKQQDHRDIYCKLLIDDQEYRTKVDMDSASIAKWNEVFEIQNKVSIIKFEIHQWKGENDDTIIDQFEYKIEEKPKGVPFNIPFKDDAELTVSIDILNTDSRNENVQAEPIEPGKLLQKYLNETGLEQSFKLIFAEIINKRIDKSECFTYAAMRLRQIGEDLKMYLANNHKMSQLLNNISEVQQEDDEQFLDSRDQ